MRYKYFGSYTFAKQITIISYIKAVLNSFWKYLYPKKQLLD
jgi:hypothetical protein